MANSDNLTRTSIDRFLAFMKFLAENGLLDEAADHVKAQGFSEIVISVDPIREIQKMIEQKFQSDPGKMTAQARQVIMSAHSNSSC